jgi:HEAT repeat protein
VNARSTRRPAWLPAAVAAAALAAGGCASFWDDVTSRDFKIDQMFTRPNPLIVLRDSTDGDERARALRALREPLQYGGDQRDQDTVVQVLTTAAVGDRQTVCRLAAISSLRTFQDPRAVEALKEAYYRAGSLNSAETASILRCQALEALGATGQPAAVDLLVRVLREPPVEGAEQDKQQKMDERIAAARALGNFKHYQAAEALVEVLRSDQDVALRDRAHDSLRQMTGKELPEDAQAWDDLLHRQDGAIAQDDSGHKFLGVIPVSWWK